VKTPLKMARTTPLKFWRLPLLDVQWVSMPMVPRPSPGGSFTWANRIDVGSQSLDAPLVPLFDGEVRHWVPWSITAKDGGRFNKIQMPPVPNQPKISGDLSSIRGRLVLLLYLSCHPSVSELRYIVSHDRLAMVSPLILTGLSDSAL